ncbi:MAG TPA: NAD(P)H-hydrate dehydratase [Gallionellaceae bacterium]
MSRPTTITQKQVAAFLKPRPHDSHKGQFGNVAVVGGNTGMIGAAILASRAALKTGAGCVHLGLLAPHAPGVDMRQPELMVQDAASALRLPGLDVLAVGCGMGHDLPAQKILHDALRHEATLVLDADALNILAVRPDLRSQLLARKTEAVITPHPGEAARLLGITTDAVQADRPAAAQELARRTGCNVVLKGADSLCVSRDGKTWLNQTGNPGMSGPGMGDVLTGIIAALIAQGLSTDEAMLLGVHLHGAAGDALAQQQASIGMTASEVTEWSRWLLNQWLRK